MSASSWKLTSTIESETRKQDHATVATAEVIADERVGFELFTSTKDNGDYKQLVHPDSEAFVRIEKQSAGRQERS